MIRGLTFARVRAGVELGRGVALVVVGLRMIGAAAQALRESTANTEGTGPAAAQGEGEAAGPEEPQPAVVDERTGP